MQHNTMAVANALFSFWVDGNNQFINGVQNVQFSIQILRRSQMYLRILYEMLLLHLNNYKHGDLKYNHMDEGWKYECRKCTPMKTKQSSVLLTWPRFV